VLGYFENSFCDTIDRLGIVCGERPETLTTDLRDLDALRTLLRDRCFDAIINFARRKAVSESVSHPLRYYDSNVRGILNLLEALGDGRDTPVIFSSSATIYGPVEAEKISEGSRCRR
jgi:UDP-glucose 4-epimerase